MGMTSIEFGLPTPSARTSLVARMIKKLPAMQEARVWSRGWEDPLEKGMTTHSSILAWRIPWTEELGGLQAMAVQRVRHDWVTDTFSPSASISRLLCYLISNLPWAQTLHQAYDRPVKATHGAETEDADFM